MTTFGVSFCVSLSDFVSVVITESGIAGVLK